jgi:hypothetical protein
LADFDARHLLANAVPLIAVVLMASGIVVKTLPLASKRPVEASDAKIAHAGRQDVHARLWEDPFVVMRDVQGGQPAERCKEALEDTAHHPATLTMAVQRALARQGAGVIVMPVFVPGGPYSQDSESRRRTRYATVMALLQAEWEPGDEEKLGFVWTFESCLDAPWSRLMPEILPYEWFKRDRGEKSESVLVLWIDEDAVTRRPLRGMRTLGDLILRGPEVCRLHESQAQPSDPVTMRRQESLLPHFEKLCPFASVSSAWRPSEGPKPWTTTAVIGPWSSATLFGLVGEIASRRSDPSTPGDRDAAHGAVAPIRPPEPRFYSSAATARIDQSAFQRALATCKQRERAAEERGETTGNRVACAADAGAIGEEFERRVVRLNATDDRLTSAFVNELMLRLDSATPLEHRRRALCTGTIVIVAEGDTRYARAFREDFARTLGGEVCGGRTGPSIVQVGYLRGLDGIAPGAAGRPVTPGTTPQNPRPAARDTLLEQAALERADGTSQFDYLRRLSVQLVDLDRALRKDGQHGIAAVGILGSDAYDKILVLDALRDRFPQAVFFAADLDARMLDAGSIRSTRNLVVASGYGLALNRQLQGSAPPFRDTYQTGTYLSTLVALDPHARTLGTGDFDSWFQQARRYEIGRTRPVNLVGAPDDSPEMKVQPEDGCTVPDPMRCRSIHSDDDWRGFAPLPALRAWLAFLVMVAAAAGLTYVLSRRARSVGRELRTYATPAGLGIVAAALAVLAAGLYAIRVNVMTRDGEPFAWLEGVSIWPTQILGLIILVVTCALLVYGRMRLRANIDNVATSFGLSTLGARERASGPEERFVLKPDSTTHWAGELDAYRSSPRARTVADEWMDFLGRMRFEACATRVALATLLFLVASASVSQSSSGRQIGAATSVREAREAGFVELLPQARASAGCFRYVIAETTSPKSAPCAASRAAMFTSMRSTWASKSPGCAVLPARRCWRSRRRAARSCSPPPSGFRATKSAPYCARLVERRRGHGGSRGPDGPRLDGVHAQAQIVFLGARPAADAGAGRGRIDAPRREELAPRPVQVRVVAVDVAQMDPGAHHVAEVHAGLLQQVLGVRRTWRASARRRSPAPAESARVEPRLLAEVDPQAVRAGAVGAAAGGLGLDRLEPQRRLVRQDRLHRDSEAGASRNGGCSISVVAGRCAATPFAARTSPARLAHGLEVRLQAAQEDRLADDRPEAAPLGRGRQGSRDRPPRPAARVRRRREAGSEEQLPGHGTLDPAETIEQPWVSIVSATGRHGIL